MAAYDLRSRSTAAKMLAPKSAGGKGQAITLTHKAVGVYDPALGKPVTTTTVQEGSGIETFFLAKEIDGTVVTMGDTRFLLSPYTTSDTVITTPSVGDTITIGTRVARIKGVEAFSPAGVVIFVRLHIGIVRIRNSAD